MGCSPGDGEGDDDEKPAHLVTISRGFWMGQTPVTQEAFQLLMGANPSYFEGAKLPVHSTTWDDALSYCQTVGMRLPTEAEWEYAARAGTTTPRYGELKDIAWYCENSGQQVHPVGEKIPNAWGFYDMLGNVAEWVADWYADRYPRGSVIDPQGPPSVEKCSMTFSELGFRLKQKYPAYSHLTDEEAGTALVRKYPEYQNKLVSSPESENPQRVLRGGTWFDDPREVRASRREGCPPWNPHAVDYGFRCVTNFGF
jgi:formylglycine-generating enzyme required for sulfatase activity